MDEGGLHLIPDVNPFDRSTSCLDNAGWAAPLVFAAGKDAGGNQQKVLYAARDVLYRSTPLAQVAPPPYGDPAKNTPGLGWKPMGSGKDRNPIMVVSVVPGRVDHLFLATGPRCRKAGQPIACDPFHVYETTDGGATYADVTGNLPVTTERQPRALTLDPQNPTGVIYLVLSGFEDQVWRGEKKTPPVFSNRDHGAAAKLPGRNGSGVNEMVIKTLS